MWNLKWRLMHPTEEGVEGAPPVAEEAVAPAGDSNIWDDLLDDETMSDAGEELEASPAAEVAEVGGEAEPKAEAVVELVAPPPAEAVVAVEKPAEAVAQPPAEVVSPAQPEPAPQQQYVPTPEEREFLRKQALVGLAERYKLTEEDATALQVEPEKVLPRLAASVHAAIYQDVLQRIYAEAPALVQHTLQERDSVRQAEEAFYGRWQDLRAHRAEVEKFAPIWRQMYPQATLEQAIEGIGATVSAMLGVVQSQVAQAPPPPPPPPAGPSTRVGSLPTPRSRLSAEEQSFVELSKSFEEEF
jgi:hypothetical protein